MYCRQKRKATSDTFCPPILHAVWSKPGSSTCWRLAGSFLASCISSLHLWGLDQVVDKGHGQFYSALEFYRKANILQTFVAEVDSSNPPSKARGSQALRVVVVVHLLLASPWLCTLGRTVIVLAAALSIVGLSSTVRLRGSGILQTLRVVVVQLLANERLLALGASSVVLAATLAV
jgi:hypothetical protein